MKSLSEMYKKHHKTKRGEDFVLHKKARSTFFNAHLKHSTTILDIGCRDGALTETFSAGKKVTGLDIDPVALGQAKKKIKGMKTKIVDLNGDWNTKEQFDAVVAAEVVEHLYQPEEVVKKVKKQLKKDGVFVGSVPNAFNILNRFRLLLAKKKNTPLADPTHINHFSYGELYGLLKKHFKTVKIVGIVDRKHLWLSRINVGLFSYGLMWYCKGKK